MTTRNQAASFRVLDVMNGPHGGKILRLRHHGGEAPSVKALKGARMRAVSPDGRTERTFTVEGFAVFGGRPSDKRLARSGRVDVHVLDDDSTGKPPISPRWEVAGPLRD
jgi:hypothetical protein